MPKFKDYADSTFTVKMKKPKKVKELNPNTLRDKTYKRTRVMVTSVPPEKRSTKNIPKYADGSAKVDYKDWLGIKPGGEAKASNGNTINSYGKSSNGKWYGWSHRAMYGFQVGDKIKPTDAGSDKEYTIKTDDQARQAAIDFAEDVS